MVPIVGEVLKQVGNAVRQALHLDKIDYYGVSYGAVDVRGQFVNLPPHSRR